MKMRPYQETMVAEIRQRWADGALRVLGVLPTGGGKTEVAIEIIRAEASPTCRALILTERKTLCHQWAKRLKLHGLAHVGISQGENSIALTAPVLVATAQSIKSRGIPAGVKLIVIDESHIWFRAHDDVLDVATANLQEAHRRLCQGQQAALERRHRHRRPTVRMDHAGDVRARCMDRAVDDVARLVDAVVQIAEIGLGQDRSAAVDLD